MVNRIVDNSGGVLVDFDSTTICMQDGEGTLEFGIGDPGAAMRVRTLQLVFSNSDKAARAADIQKLGNVLRAAARESVAQNNPNWHWWEFYEDWEYPKRALLYGGTVQASGGTLPHGARLNSANVSLRDCALTVGPWESTVPVELSFTGVAVRGGMVTLPPLGDIDGRIDDIRVHSPSNSGTGVLLGIKRGPHKTDFEALWPVFSPPQTTTYVVIGNEYLRQSDTTAPPIDSTTDPDHWQGNYLVVPYMSNVDASLNLAWMQIRWGFIADTYGPKRYIGQSVDTVPVLDEMTIIPGLPMYPTTAATLNGMAWQINTAAVDGVANDTVELWGCIFVPAEHYMISNALTASSPTAYDFIARTEPNGVIQATRGQGGQRYASLNITLKHKDWQYPAEGGRMVASNYEDDTATGTWSVDMVVYPRWAEYRSRDV